MRQEIEVMRVLRVPPMGKLVVEVNGKPYETIDEINDGPTTRRLLAAIGELITFAGNYESLVEAGVAPPVAAGTSELTASAESLTAEQARFLEQLEQQRDALRLQAQTIASAATPPPLPPEKPLPPLRPAPRQPADVATQIDAILQSLKADNPALADQVIHLRQNPKGGLHIEVNGQLYNEPGEIADSDVRKLIRQAVQTWRSR